jgi:hypothetical protein
MIDDLRRRLSKRSVGIVAKGHDARIGDLVGEEVFQQERLRLRVCPGGEGVTAEAVDSHDTKLRQRLAKATEL